MKSIKMIFQSPILIRTRSHSHSKGGFSLDLEQGAGTGEHRVRQGNEEGRP